MRACRIWFEHPCFNPKTLFHIQLNYSFPENSNHKSNFIILLITSCNNNKLNYYYIIHRGKDKE